MTSCARLAFICVVAGFCLSESADAQIRRLNQAQCKYLGENLGALISSMTYMTNSVDKLGDVGIAGMTTDPRFAQTFQRLESARVRLVGPLLEFTSVTRALNKELQDCAAGS